MKKKFLSLMMAAAVVATTSVSAFADETVNKDGGQVDVTVTGSVNNNDDIAPAGTLNVTVPTALTFSVNSTGVLTGSDIVVTNRGTEEVDVFVYEFVDSSPNKGIIVKENVQEGDKRSNVSLAINGNRATAYLSSTAGSNRGVNVDTSTGSTITPDGLKISTVGTGNQNTDRLELRGSAGKAGLTESEGKDGINERFTLKLKIKKAAKAAR